MEASRKKIEKEYGFRLDNQGLTLVELICAIAIFSIIVATVGGVLVFSSKTYQKGSAETAVQQEAQFAVNRIGDMIQDSVEVRYTEGMDAQGNYARLVMDCGTRKYLVAWLGGSAQIMYGEAGREIEDMNISASDLLAENISSFCADTTGFDVSKTVRIDMTVDADGREYAMSYNMTARNDDVTTNPVTPIRTAAIIVESRLILEPGQSYSVPVSIIGSAYGITASSSDESQMQVTGIGNESVDISMELAAGQLSDIVYLTIATNEKGDDAITPLASATIEVQIRRVDGLTVAVTLLEGEEGKKDAKYKFTSSLTEYTPYLAKNVVATWDNDYKNPYAVQWNYDTNFMLYGNSGNFADYFEVVDKQEDINNPYLILKLKKNLVAGSKLTVEGVSKHAAINGGNKCGTAYNTAVKSSVMLAGPLLDGTETAVLEPGESYTTSLPIEQCDITAIPSVETLESKGTKVEFKNGEFKITLGKTETGDSAGKITLELRAVGDVNVDSVRTVIIYVRRINSMRVELKHLIDDGHPIKTPLVKGADYQFCTRIKGTNLYKTDDETEEEFLPNPFAVEISWEFTISGVIADVPGATGSIIWDEYDLYSKTGDYGKIYEDNPATNPGNQYYKMIGLATNSEHPCINFCLTGDFPATGELKVTARALHPTGKDADGTLRNQTGEAYIEGDMIASASLKGSLADIIDPDDPFDDNDIDFLPYFLRGQDFTAFPDSHETANYPWGQFPCQGRWFLRTREIWGRDENGDIVYGPWTSYRRAMENGSAKKLNAYETGQLQPNKRYQIEMAFMSIDPDTKTVYWPYDSSLTEQGSGTGFEGFTNGWDESMQPTVKEDYSSTYNIGIAYITFLNGDTYTNCYGSLQNPVVLSEGGYFSVYLGGSTIEYSHYQGKCYSRVQQLVGNTWVEVGNQGWTIQERSSFFSIYNIQSAAAGTYRISFKVKEYGAASWTTWNGDVWNPAYESLQKDEYLLCGANGTRGYIYIRIE